LIPVWQFGSAHFAGYRAVIHLGSHLNLRRISVFSFRPLPLLRQGVLRCCFHFPRNIFRGDPLTQIWRLLRRLQMRERSGRQDVPE
jgi:hypothetical protein